MNKQFNDSYIFFLLLFFCCWFVFDFCFLFFSSFLPAHRSVFLFSFYFFFLYASVCSCFFSFLLIFWGPCVFSDRLRGNPVRNHIMTICSVFRHQIIRCCTVISRFMQKESQRHNDKERAKTSLKNIPLNLFARFERVVCERELETEHNCNIY